MFKWALFRKAEFKQTYYSPNGRVACCLALNNNQITYSVTRDNHIIIKPSVLGLKICGEPELKDELRIVRVRQQKHNETIEMQWGEDKFIKNNYHEIAFYFSESCNNYRIFTIRFRIFDNAVAFRYEIPPQPKFQRITIEDELTEFNLDLNSTAWKIPAFQPDRYEYNYEKCQVYDLSYAVHTPLTIRTPSNNFISLHEAALYDYGAMNLKLDGRHALKTDITPLSDGTKAHVDLPFQTPWRLIMLADSAIELTTNRTMFVLNEPPKKDFSWVKTLKFIGIWWAMYVGEWTWAPGDKHGATTKHAKEYIDSAVKLGVGGLLIEGWNEGWRGDWLENGKNNSFTKSTPDFNLQEVATYARNHNIELVGHHETVGFVDNYEKQLEAAYNIYAVNNIHYIKTGYANSMIYINGRKEYHHSQLGVNHYQRTVELAARKHICLDIHEPIKGTGIERTWPNLLSREGARGQEYEGGSLSPTHACILPYTRLLSGGMDYTSGIFDLQNKTKPVFTTLARQLAYFVVIYSGMQMAADRPLFYENKFPKLFEFIRDVPTNFEKTIPLAGEIGEYYVVARKDRDTANWYIGGVTDGESRKIHLNFDFLESGEYLAKIYADAGTAHYQNNPFGMDIFEKKINRSMTLTIQMAPGGGFAIQLQRL